MADADLSLAELYRVEAIEQATLLHDGLLALEHDGRGGEGLAGLMRAAHSLKGAARITGHDVASRVAHALEDVFVAAQADTIALDQARVDVLLHAVDVLRESADVPEAALEDWEAARSARADAIIAALASVAAGGSPDLAIDQVTPGAAAAGSGETRPSDSWQSDRLLGFASEAMVTARWLQGHARGSLHLRRTQQALDAALNELRQSLPPAAVEGRVARALEALRLRLEESGTLLRRREEDLAQLERRVGAVSERLYEEVLAGRMRPFGDAVASLPRLARDTARQLGKEARVIVEGERTPVDREVFRRLDAPLAHLVRNAVDHGLEDPGLRELTGKTPHGTIRARAGQQGGRLVVTIEDDGQGIDVEAVRRAVIARGHAGETAAAAMSDAELLEFLFLPGFSLRGEITPISGRGVGLDVVQSEVRAIGGQVRVTSTAGKGATFELRLPLTLSVIRALIVAIGDDAYAFPLSRIDRVEAVAVADLAEVEGRPHFAVGDRQVGVVWIEQALGLPVPPSERLTVVVLGDGDRAFGVAVDRLLGERELVLRGLDPRLGRIPNVNAAALLPDGSPVIVFDVDDLIQSIENFVTGARPILVAPAAGPADTRRRRVLVADDSLTVRELERKLIADRGYDVHVAVDGLDAWNAVRGGHYDLVVTDVDMPRMDGIELVRLIKSDPNLNRIPVMIVSYKDRDEDRRRGLEAGADHYLTKGSFYDETMLQAVEDLIGPPTP